MERATFDEVTGRLSVLCDRLDELELRRALTARPMVAAVPVVPAGYVLPAQPTLGFGSLADDDPASAALAEHWQGQLAAFAAGPLTRTRHAGGLVSAVSGDVPVFVAVGADPGELSVAIFVVASADGTVPFVATETVAPAAAASVTGRAVAATRGAPLDELAARRAERDVAELLAAIVDEPVPAPAQLPLLPDRPTLTVVGTPSMT